jgi:hypothetical protein
MADSLNYEGELIRSVISSDKIFSPYRYVKLAGIGAYTRNWKNSDDGNPVRFAKRELIWVMAPKLSIGSND